MATTTEDTFEDLLKTKALIDKIGPDEFVKNIASKRSEIEDVLFSRVEVDRDELLAMIKNHLMVLNNYYQNAEGSTLNLSESQVANLAVACLTVGYTMGVGKEAMAALPILALAGANLELGETIVNMLKHPTV